MKILGIETSCDETSASVVENGQNVLSNIVASSSKIHEISGGIIPEEAARQQIKSIASVVDLSLKNAKSNISNIDAIAVTNGPGLIGSLLVGVEYAKTISSLQNIPIVPINHLVAHIYANWLSTSNIPQFPALALVVSGGHTDLVSMTNHGKIKWIGGTRDDAAGEAFDKAARLLGLPYPGGPAISSEADKYNEPNTNLNLFPRPMVHSKNYDWSFSGLKTSVINQLSGATKLKKDDVSKYAAEVQEAIVEVLVTKTLRAVETYKPKSLLLAGGVSANTRLRKKFSSEIRNKQLKVKLYIPEVKYCTDNAAYIASCAFFNYSPIPWKQISADPELTIVQ